LRHRGELLLINVGDSRAVVLADDFSVITKTNDHKPTQGSAEESRIIAMGGRVSHENDIDVHRVVSQVHGQPNLAMSRAMGDFSEKGGRRLSRGLERTSDLTAQWNKFHVLAAPELQLISIPKQSSPWIWLGSDGVWDVTTVDELAALTYQFQQQGGSAATVRDLLKNVILPRNAPRHFEADNSTLLLGRLMAAGDSSAIDGPSSPASSQYRVGVMDSATFASLKPASSLPPQLQTVQPLQKPRRRQSIVHAAPYKIPPLSSSGQSQPQPVAIITPSHRRRRKSKA
jgi:serine/threonine protein phosphatase PrpC